MGQVLAGRYRVEELIGSGAWGIVVSAHHVHTQKKVALKLLAANTSDQVAAVEARITKARTASRLRSPNVARIIEVGATEDGMRFIATEHLKGVTLDAWIEARGKLPPEEAAQLVTQVCAGLAEAHAVGIVHGNLKPQNLLLTESDRTLKILDFGAATPIDTQGSSAWFASPAYLSPEQIHGGEVDPRADVWALGVILYQMLSGTLPFGADSVSGMLVSVVMDRPALLTDVTYELATLVGQCLEKDPGQRFQNVRALAVALSEFAGDDGARLAERVRDAAATIPSDDPLDIDDRAEVSEVRRATTPPPPPVRRTIAVTTPSERVEQRRKALLRKVVLTSVAASTAIVVAAAAGLAAKDDAPAAPATVTAAELPAATVAPTKPEVAPEPPPVERAAIPAPDPERVPSPHALPPAQQTKAAPAPRVRPPAPRVHRAAAPSPPKHTRLPAALPTTREATTPPPSRSRRPVPPLRTRTMDDNAMFTERK